MITHSTNATLRTNNNIRYMMTYRASSSNFRESDGPAYVRMLKLLIPLADRTSIGDKRSIVCPLGGRICSPLYQRSTQ